MEDAKVFLSALFEHATRNCVVSYANSDARTFKPVEKYDLTGPQIIKFIKTYDVPGRAVYACVSDVPSGKRSKQNVGGTFAAFTDLDFKGIAHSRMEIEAAIAGLRVRPSFVIFTGNGLHLWWIFFEPVADHERVERLLRHISDVLAGDRAVCEVSRVMRIPNTHNTKNGANEEVRIIQRNDERYTIEVLEEYFEFAMPLLQRVERVDQTKREPIKLDLYQQFVKLNSIYKPGTFKGQDNEALWSEMRFPGNVYVTTRDVLNSMLGSGVPVNDALDEIQRQCIERIPEAAAWDWDDATLGMPQHMEKAISFLAKKLDALEKQEDPPAWLEKDDRIKRARNQIKKLAEAEPHAPGNGALNGSGKANGTIPHAPENNAPAGPVGADDPLDVYAGSGAVPFPRGVLPPVIEAYAVGRGKLMGVDPNGLAMGALAACATVIPNSVKIQPIDHDEDWTEATRLWVMHVGGVSAAKSAILDQPFIPVMKIDAEIAQQNKQAMAEWLELPKDEQKKEGKPPQPGIMVDDITVESLGEISQDSPDGTALKKDEGGGWFGSFEKYSGKKGGAADRSVWIRYYDGRRLFVRRIGRGTVEAEHFGGCVVLAIQPDVICKLAEGHVDDGLVQRFNPVILNKRTEGDDNPLAEDAREFARLIPELYRMPRQSFGVVKFSPKAQEVWKEMNKRIMKTADIFEVRNRQLSQHIVKYGTQYARMCLLFHVIEHPQDFMRRAVSADVCERVQRWFWEFLFPHARHFYVELLSRSDNADVLLAVADYILAHEKKTLVSRDIARGTGVLRGLEPQNIVSIFSNLEAWGWLTRGIQTRSNSVPYNVNPKVHDGRFAARTALVKQRNADYADAINYSKAQKLKQNENAERSTGSRIG